jgi:hypothetical protein
MKLFKSQSQLNQYLVAVGRSPTLNVDYYKRIISLNEGLLCEDCSVESFRKENRSPKSASLLYNGVNLSISECGDVSDKDGNLKHYKRADHHTVKIGTSYVPIAKLMVMAFDKIDKPMSISYTSGFCDILSMNNIQYKQAYLKAPLKRKDFVFTQDELDGFSWSYKIGNEGALSNRLSCDVDEMIGGLQVKPLEDCPSSVIWRDIEYRGIDLSINQYGAVKKISLSKNIPKVISSCFIKGALTVTILDSDRKKMRISVASLMMRAFHGVNKTKIHVEYLDGNPRNTVLRNIQLIENRYSAKN